MQKLTPAQYALLLKIAKAKLTAAELTEVKEKISDVIASRTNKQQ